jgi:hypothetical protein
VKRYPGTHPYRNIVLPGRSAITRLKKERNARAASHARDSRERNKKSSRDRKTALLSVVFLVFIVHIRPQVLVTGRAAEVIFNRPQVTEGVVVQVPFTPPLIIPAPSAMPVKSVTAAVRRQASFTFTHLSSPHLTGSAEKI